MASAPGRRQEIRRAAVMLFAERGYYGTSMEDIAAVVGMRASSLYNHVASKQAMLADIMLTTMNDLLDLFADAAPTQDHAQRLRAAMEAHVRYHAGHRAEAHIGNRELASLEQPQHDVVRELRRRYARGWEALIGSGADAGQFDVEYPRLVAYALLEMGIGVAQWYREDGAMSLDVIASAYADMALRQVGILASLPSSD